jgi:outer membrane cobalamin receptor
MKEFLIYLLLIRFSFPAISQVQVNGRVIDKATREPLELAYIKVVNANTTTITDKMGHFNISLRSNGLSDQTFTLFISYIGFETKEITIVPSTDVINIELEKGIVSLKEVVITPHLSTQSFHAISKIDLNLQPVRSAQDILRTVPGLFIGQHQGGGKAEQIFLRGFDIDHGTDINISVDGLPVNMVSHAHGQGYADLHFLIPELTGNVDYGKGPYYSNRGNLGTAGYVSLSTLNTLDKSTVKIETGQFNTMRALAMIDLLSLKQKEKGTSAYVAGEFLYSDGPFDLPQHFNRFNLFGKFNTRVGRKSNLSLIASTLSSGWDASGQVPERAIDNGSIGRFGYIDSLEGGSTSRTNASAKLITYYNNNSNWENQVYYSRYNFNLHSNFTFFLNDPVNGDQIRQREGRNMWGYHSRFSHSNQIHGWNLASNYGAGFRYDATVNSELSHSVNRNTVLSYAQLGNIKELNAFAFVDKNFERKRWLLNIGGRLDYFHFSYLDKLQLNQQPNQEKFIVSPKLNIQYTLNDRIQLYIKAGKGFHSNDARVVILNRGRDILPAAFGSDIGVLLKPTPRLLINAAAWYLYLKQEFVYVGDEGIVEPSGKTRRVGIDVSGRYQFTNWLFADININIAKPRSLEQIKGNDYIPLAPSFTSTGGISVQMKKGFNGSLRYRSMKDRPANENNSIIAKGYTVTDFSFNYTKKKYEIGLAIENLFNVKWKETQFDTESRLKNEPAPVSEIHFTPGAPFFARVKVAVFF